MERKNQIDGADRTTVTHLSLAVQLLPTPTGSDAKGPSPAHSGTVAEAVQLLPTPTARLGPRGMPNRETAHRRMFEEGRRDLEDAVALLPTPNAGDAEGGSTRLTHARGNPTLLGAVKLLPTPTALVRGVTTDPRYAAGKPSTDPPPGPETTEDA